MIRLKSPYIYIIMAFSPVVFSDLKLTVALHSCIKQEYDGCQVHFPLNPVTLESAPVMS